MDKTVVAVAAILALMAVFAIAGFKGCAVIEAERHVECVKAMNQNGQHNSSEIFLVCSGGLTRHQNN